ncbi:hypothetical protein COCCU_08385 [Corynebacterium occultum]|uniref:AsnC family protein n=1 Tax=Corynebacterium occultum TaxID=2675219 RepID=A0A6B8W4X3_9CORY|nr:hypothetical protein COCCU_08385 [Corynebacterium occultum]
MYVVHNTVRRHSWCRYLAPAVFEERGSVILRSASCLKPSVYYPGVGPLESYTRFVDKRVSSLPGIQRINSTLVTKNIVIDRAYPTD